MTINNSLNNSSSNFSVTNQLFSHGEVVGVTALNNASSPYTVLVTDFYLSVDSTGGNVTVNLLPSPSTGARIIIADTGGSAQTNAITVSTATSSIIYNGSSSSTEFIQTNYGALDLTYDGSAWVASVGQAELLPPDLFGVTEGAAPFLTALGYGAGGSSNTGNNNTAIGYQALGASFFGADNTAVGTQALLANFEGNFNTAIGTISLTATNGANNTCVGYSSGSNYTGTEGNNICVGANVLGTTGESSQTRIGLQGTQTGCFIAGISGATTPNASFGSFVDNTTGQVASAFTSTGGTLDGDGTGGLDIYPSQTTGTIVLGGSSSTSSVALSVPNVTTRGNLSLQVAGNKLSIATGSNASIGQATLSSGGVTVSTTAVSASSLIFLSHGAISGIPGILSQGTIVPATSFVINSTNPGDNSVVNWWIIN